MAERKYICRTCGDREWGTHAPASRHNKSHPDHVIEVIVDGEIKPFVPGKGGYKKPGKVAVAEKPPEALAEAAAEAVATATDKAPPKFLMIGTLRMPMEDWGYSSVSNLLVVAETYEEIKREFGFEGKVGDFCAELVRIFRALGGYDGYDLVGGDHGLSVAVVEGEAVAKPDEAIKRGNDGG